MKSQKIICLLLVITIFVFLLNLGFFSTSFASEQHNYCMQLADLQFTTGSVSLVVEQGGSNITTIRVQNYGGEPGNATIERVGGAITGITFVFSTTTFFRSYPRSIFNKYFRCSPNMTVITMAMIEATNWATIKILRVRVPPVP